MPSTARLTYCGHSTVILETERGKRFIIDPFLDGNPLCPEPLKKPERLDYICLTHGHGDHSSSAVSLAKDHEAIVFGTFELLALLGKDGVPEAQLEMMNKGGRVRIADGAGLSVKLTQAFHSSSYDCADGVTRYAGEAAGVLIELESGRTVYHAGDTMLFDDMRLISAEKRPSVALLPIGDRYTMGPEDAAAAVNLLQPEIVIPIHHSTFPGLSGRPEEFAELLQNNTAAVKVLKPGETLEF